MANNYLPKCKPIELEEYSNKEQFNIRYNELLFDESVHSFYPRPEKNKKGYWVMEVERYKNI